MSQTQTELSTPVNPIVLEPETKLEATITISSQQTVGRESRDPDNISVVSLDAPVKRTRKSAKKMEQAHQVIIAGRQAGLHRLTVINNLVEQFGLTVGSATMYYYKYEGPKVTPLQQD
jgi:hypothetical protein